MFFHGSEKESFQGRFSNELTRSIVNRVTNLLSIGISDPPVCVPPAPTVPDKLTSGAHPRFVGRSGRPP